MSGKVIGLARGRVGGKGGRTKLAVGKNGGWPPMLLCCPGPRGKVVDGEGGRCPDDGVEGASCHQLKSHSCTCPIMTYVRDAGDKLHHDLPLY